MIRFLDLQRQHREIETGLVEAMTRVVRGGRFILGVEVDAFEKEWAAYCGVPGAAGVASGTDALTLALVATNAVRPGHHDEVITSPLTAGYTAIAILKAGGVPVFADIDPETCTLDANAVSRAISPCTRAVVPVHLYGRMCNMKALCDIAAQHGLIVVEDAAQAHGALGERSAGAFGAAGAFSFYPTKNLGACGDAGAVVSMDPDVVKTVKTLREGGAHDALQEGAPGWNSRLDEIQAAVLRVKLPYLDKWNEKRRFLAGLYTDELRGISQLQLPAASSPDTHVQHLYVVQHPERDRLRAHLFARGIETLIHYPFLLHQQPLLRCSTQSPLPQAEKVAPRLLSLPLYPQLEIEEAYEVVSAIRSFKMI